MLDDVPLKLVKYVPVCLPDYRKVKKDFDNAQAKGEPAPPLKLEVALDRQEILPDGVDDW